MHTMKLDILDGEPITIVVSGLRDESRIATFLAEMRKLIEQRDDEAELQAQQRRARMEERAA